MVVVAGTSMEFIVQLTGTLFTVLWPEQDARLKVELHQYDGCRRYRFVTVTDLLPSSSIEWVNRLCSWHNLEAQSHGSRAIVACGDQHELECIGLE